MCVQRWGRVRMFVVKWGVQHWDDKGHLNGGQNFRSTDVADFSYHFQFSNSKPHTIALRKGTILFKKGRQILHRREVFSELNIGPGKIESVMDDRHIDHNVIKQIRECDCIYFVTTKPNGRKLGKNLSDVPTDDDSRLATEY